jgi:Tfp pilus tip-associated adhesin PilY1
MSPRNWRFGRTPIARATFAIASLALLGSAAARGDDRSLLRTSSADPYLFILLDTSGSMNWAPKTAGTCDSGDCFVPLNGDDPSSKFYQAKQSLFEVLSDPNLGKVNFGFGSYNQDVLSADQKHWLYQASGSGVNLSGTTYFPAAGAQEVFGNLWSCGSGSGDSGVGCSASNPADLSDSWELTRVRRLPKGGLTFSSSSSVTFYIRNGSTTYKVTYTPNGGSYGGTVSMKVAVLRCTNSGCSSTTSVGTTTVSYTPISDFIAWDNAIDRTPPENGYYSQATSSDSSIDSDTTCNGWDPNTDTTSDKSSGYNLRWATDSSDPRGGGGVSGPFSSGDVIPLDWKTDHKIDILKRLAPNYVDSTTVPNFKVASYLNNSRSGSDSFLRLKDESQRPLIANGSTPLGASVKQFRTWYSGCSADTCGSLGGWVKVASSSDNSFECRQKFLLIVTDGDETCNGDPCKYTKLLKDQYGVITYVVAFGVTATSGNKLSCMADADHLFYPKDQDELVEDLKLVLGKINEQSSTFASAAVPSVQADVADHIYLSSFTPLNSESFWDGHLDGYLKPLPLKDGKPDRSIACSAAGGATRSSCWLWDSGAQLKTQAPMPSDLASTVSTTTLRLGSGDTQRRVFYAKAAASGAVPSTLRLFAPPTGDPKTNPTPDWSDLLNGFKIPLPVTTTDSTNDVTRVKKIMANALEIKSATVSSPGVPDVNITYLLGDIFHADPVLVDRPDNFSYFASNLYAKAGVTDCTGNPGYQCFASQQKRRRKMLLAGANDGQLHAIDAGGWDNSAQEFTDGTGKEIFSYIPRLALPIVRTQAESEGTTSAHQIFGVDGTPRIADVFIDTNHNGTPTAADREWRTVAIGGFREGGSIDGASRLGDFVSGYYALDVTHPDKLDANNIPTSQTTVPTCLDLANATVSGCGTLPFPAVLWEYTDSIGSSQLDEDRNGYADLGQTWSVPTIGRIKVIESGKQVDKFVAIFAGGMDADNKTSPKRGNWLYMVDIETGQTLYKRALVGSAPSDAAVLDKDQDGYLDTIYIGTISGIMFKVDVSTPGTIQSITLATNQAVPPLATSATVKRIVDTSWDPFQIFDTGGRPIYIAPTLFYVSQLSRYALAFGTGDRENLWNLDSQVGRFYLIVDENFTAAMVASGALPKTEASYQALNVSSGDVSATSDFVVNPPSGKSKGWFLTLTANERVITQTFGLAGVVIFSSFQPQDTVEDGVCALGGSSHIFVVYANNGNSVMTVGGTATRFRVVPKFVTNPYVEQGATNNTPGSGGGGSGSGGGGSSSTNSEQLDATQEEILQQLKKFFPKGTKFGNYWISVSGLRSDTGYERYATVPVGIIERNWKEN